MYSRNFFLFMYLNMKYTGMLLWFSSLFLCENKAHIKLYKSNNRYPLNYILDVPMSVLFLMLPKVLVSLGKFDYFRYK